MGQQVIDQIGGWKDVEQDGFDFSDWLRV